MNEEKHSKAPTHNVFTVIELESRKDKWVEIGAAWPIKDKEGFSIRLNALPVNGKLVIMKRKDEESDSESSSD